MEHKSVDKSKLNFSIDMLLILLMMSITGIGLLMKYVLIPGFQRNERYGNNADLEFLGLTRHEWGTIHLVIALTFLGLLILHIVFHWNMILHIFSRMIPSTTWRIAFASLLTIISLLLISFPLFVKPEIIDREPVHRNRNDRNINSFNGFTEPNQFSRKVDSTLSDNNIPEKQTIVKQNYQSANEKYEVFGYQTLQFVADKYNVPANKIAAYLNVPVSMTSEKLGRLKRQYSFSMDDVRACIAEYQKKKESKIKH
jgi:ribosomal protein S6